MQCWFWMRFVIDGNNVMGSRPDGWWNDRTAGMARLAQQIAEWCWTHEDEVMLFFDGRSAPAVSELAGGNLAVRFSGRTARDAADDSIVAELDKHSIAELSDTIVVTADKGLIARLPPEVAVLGPRHFLSRLE